MSALGEHLAPLHLCPFDVHPAKRSGQGIHFISSVSQAWNKRDTFTGYRRGAHGAEHPTGPALHKHRGTLGVKGLDPFSEANGAAHLTGPVLRIGQIRVGGHLAGDVAHDGDPRSPKAAAGGDVLKLHQHRVHVRAVKRVGDAEVAGFSSLGPKPLRHRSHRIRVPADDRLARTVKRRDAHRVPLTDQVRAHLFLAGLQRGHAATALARLHQTSPRAHQPGSVRQGEHPAHVGRHQLANGVPKQEVGLDPKGHPQAKKRRLHRKERGLGPLRLIKKRRLSASIIGEEHRTKRPVKVRVTRFAGRVEGRPKRRVGVIKLMPHANGLAALTGEEKGHLLLLDALGDQHIPVGGLLRQRVQFFHRVCGVVGKEARSILKVGSPGGRGVEHIVKGLLVSLGQPRRPARRLLLQGSGALSGDEQRRSSQRRDTSRHIGR